MNGLEIVGPVLAASLIGCLHCAGMCGPIVAFYSGGDATTGRARLLGHLGYNGARGVAYVALGAVAGAVGAAVDLAGSAAGLGRVAVVLAGVVMIVWGVALLFEAGGLKVPHVGMPEALHGRTVELLRRLRERPPIVRAVLIGLATALMPCGWLYAFAVTAAGTGSVAGGALVMGAFWAGTVPILFGIGFGIQALVGRLRRHVPVMAAIVLIGVGLYAVLGRLNIPSFALRVARDPLHAPRSAPADGEEPCCH